MLRATFLVSFAAALGFATARPTTAATAAPEYFTNPAKELEFFNVRHLTASPRIMLPTLYVRIMHWGRVPRPDLTIEERENRRREKDTTLDIASVLDLETAQAIATRLYDDLAAQLRGTGWQVITHEQIKSHPVLTSLPQQEKERDLGVPVQETREDPSPRRYWLITPPEMPAIAAGATGPIWAMKDLLRELDANAMIVTYTFDIVATSQPASPDELDLDVDLDLGPERQPETQFEPRLQLASVSAEFYNARLVGGSMESRLPQTVSQTVGIFTEAPDRVPKGASALSRAAGVLASFSRRRTNFMFEPDPTGLPDRAIEVGAAFNATIARNISSYVPR